MDCSFLLTFYGFLISSKLTTSPNYFDPDKDVSFAYLSFQVHFYRVFLKTFTGSWWDLFWYNSSCRFSVLSISVQIFIIKPFSDTQAPLFLPPDNKRMPKPRFSYRLKQTAMQGQPQALLQQLGCWTSSAYAS